MNDNGSLCPFRDKTTKGVIFMGLFDKIFGTRSQREVKKLQPIVNKVLALESEYSNLSEEALKYNINLLPDELDNQLAAAVASMK